VLFRLFSVVFWYCFGRVQVCTDHLFLRKIAVNGKKGAPKQVKSWIAAGKITIITAGLVFFFFLKIANFNYGTI